MTTTSDTDTTSIEPTTASTDQAAESTEASTPQLLSAEYRSELLTQLEASPSKRVPMEIDPSTLVVDGNIRIDTGSTVDAEFVADIAAVGFHQDPTVFINAEGHLQVFDGHRRILAAREIGWNPCPVVLRMPPKGRNRKERRVSVMTTQWGANAHHVALSAADKLRTVTEMLDLGLTPTTIERKLHGITAPQAEAMGKVGPSSIARDLYLGQQLTIEQSAVLTEFDDDPDAVTALTRAAQRSTHAFDRAAKALRTRRASEAARAEVAADLTAQGYTVLDDIIPESDFYDTHIPLAYLRTAEGTTPTPDDIRDPHNWAVTLTDDEIWTEIATGTQVPEDAIDWDTRDDPDHAPAEGLLHLDAVQQREVWSIDGYLCINLESEGLTNTFDSPTTSADSVGQDDPEHGQEAGETPEEAAMAAALAAQTAKSAERRRTITLNKAARVATPIRRAWLTELFSRKTPPKGAVTLAARLVAAAPAMLSEYGAREKAAELLGIDRDTLAKGTVFDKASEARVQVISFALVCAAVENRLHAGDNHPDFWRRSGFTTHGGPNLFVLYLKYLHDIGFDLAPVERVVIQELTPEAAAAEITAAENGNPDPLD